MEGTKARYLETWAQQSNRAFLRFDYTGHGYSSGDFSDGCIGEWAEDAVEAVRFLTKGPQILVGSSMGGWIALLVAREVPERLAGLVAIAAAPDFTEDLVWNEMSSHERAIIRKTGRIEYPSDYYDDPDALTWNMIEDWRKRYVPSAPLTLDVPVRLFHVM